jgi:hypothetical protein
MFCDDATFTIAHARDGYDRHIKSIVTLRLGYQRYPTLAQRTEARPQTYLLEIITTLLTWASCVGLGGARPGHAKRLEP